MPRADHLHDLLSDQAAVPAADAAHSDFFEYVSEMFQDNDRAGYINLGNASEPGSYYFLTPDNTDTFINAQAGDDNIFLANHGNDTVHGGSGDDVIRGGYGNDTLYGDSGNDYLIGGGGDDKLFGGSGNDVLDSGTGNNQLDGGSGDDRLYAMAGNDVLNGGSGNDYLDAGAGNDVLIGGTGNDILHGGAGDDNLDGGTGNDVLVGGAGKDILTGGAGADTFVFNSASDSQMGQQDVITDFQRGQDKIDLSAIHGIVQIDNQSDGQHVHVAMNGAGPDLDIIVHTTDGTLLTTNDFHW
jgi:Ca2+-binding RTX toxin-like protein